MPIFLCSLNVKLILLFTMEISFYHSMDNCRVRLWIEMWANEWPCARAHMRKTNLNHKRTWTALYIVGVALCMLRFCCCGVFEQILILQSIHFMIVICIFIVVDLNYRQLPDPSRNFIMSAAVCIVLSTMRQTIRTKHTYQSCFVCSILITLNIETVPFLHKRRQQQQ